jgi:hypothetical protein
MKCEIVNLKLEISNWKLERDRIVKNKSGEGFGNGKVAMRKKRDRGI